MQDSAEKKTFSIQFLYFAIFTTATILLWIVFEVFRSLTQPAEITEITSADIEPLSSDIDEAGLLDVKQRIHIPQSELNALESGFVPTVESGSPVTESEGNARIGTSGSQEATGSGSF